MINFKVIPGKNCKTFIKISNLVTKQDMEIYDIIVAVLTRTEFKPFLQGFDKNITYTYLFNDYIFPIQFWPDVKKQIDQFIPEQYILENEELMYYNDIDRDDFDEWLSLCKLPEDINTTAEEYEYQRDSVFLGIQNKIGRIEVATAGGKTFITYMYCRYLIDFGLIPDKQILIVVPSKALCNQLKRDFKDYDQYFKRHITVETIFAGSKKLIGADVICGTFQSLGNYEQEYFNDFGALLCDEVHRAKAYTIRNEIYAKLLNCEYYFAMTGTMPKYKTLDYLHIVSMFGAELVKRTAKQNIDAGVSCAIKIHAIQIYYPADIKDYSYDLKEQGILGIEKYRIEKSFFQNYDIRTDLLVKLINAFSANSLIMVDTVEYAESLFNYLKIKCQTWDFHIIHGKIDNRDEIFDGMRNAKSNYGIIGTYGTMSTGISIKNIENLYFPDGGKSEIRIRQTLGRGMRLFPTKEYCNVFDFQDMMPFCAFLNHSRERNRIYKEQQFPVKITKVYLGT